MAKAREKGLIRMEGKEYTMKEGDIVETQLNSGSFTSIVKVRKK